MSEQSLRFEVDYEDEDSVGLIFTYNEDSQQLGLEIVNQANIVEDEIILTVEETLQLVKFLKEETQA